MRMPLTRQVRPRYHQLVRIALGIITILAIAVGISGSRFVVAPNSTGVSNVLYVGVAILLVGCITGIVLRLKQRERNSSAIVSSQYGIPQMPSPSRRSPTNTTPFRSLLILDLVSPITVEDVKRAYRQKASQWHPDSGGDTNQFQELQIAYTEALQYAELCERLNRPVSMGGLQPNLVIERHNYLPNVILGVLVLVVLIIGGMVAARFVQKDILLVFSWAAGIPTLAALISLTLADLRFGSALIVTGSLLVVMIGGWTAILGRFNPWFRNLFIPDRPSTSDLLNVETGWIAVGYATIWLALAILFGWTLHATRHPGRTV